SLNILSAELNTKTIIFYPDAGAIHNAHVLRQYRTTFKLLQQWGYDIQVAWWGQTTKGEHLDIDDLLVAGRSDEIQYITVAQFELLIHKPHIRLHGFKDLLGWFPKLKNRLAQLNQKRSRWGFAPVGTVEVEPKTAEGSGSTGLPIGQRADGIYANTDSPVSPPVVQTIEYEQGQRLEVWQKTLQEGIKFICDLSPTGTGKSYDCGLTNSELFNSRQVIFLSSEHRNPTVSTLATWSDLEARHGGLVRDSFGRKRRTQPGEPYSISPNCSRNQTISTLRSLNIDGADTAQVICATCPHLEACRGGYAFGFLHQRQSKLKANRFRAHPESLPDPIEYDYSNVVLLWDEWSTLLRTTRTIEVTLNDLDQLIVHLATKHPILYRKLAIVLQDLRAILTGETPQVNRYGWNHAAILELLPSLPADLDYCKINQAIKPNLKTLDPTAEYGVSVAELPPGIRKKFTDSDTKVAQTIKEKFLLQWLLPFFKVLKGAAGYLRIVHGVLSITLPDERLIKIASSAKANIFLDATGDAMELAQLLGVSPTEIVNLKQSVCEPDNLDVIQVATLGRLGCSDRSAILQQRIDAIVKTLQAKDPTAKVIDFKKFAHADTLRWWIESRGINDLESATTLILTGTPCRNLSHLEAEFTLMYGRTPQPGTVKVKYPVQIKVENDQTQKTPVDINLEINVSVDPEFRSFVRRRILADIHQAIGRLRVHRRPDQKLTVYFIGDYPLDIPVTVTLASSITPEAATKTERVEMAIKAAVAQLKRTGEKVTQGAIASLSGYSQQHISRFRDLLKMLLCPPNSKMSKPHPEEEPVEPEELQWLATEYLPLVASSPHDEILPTMDTLESAYSRSDFAKIWEATPGITQIRILTELMLMSPEPQLMELASAIGLA
ncbi:MAG TPA: hypothetical protein DEG47_12915, partial [Cyanobacteria bacterium UBA11148]|nr:hypothetical protein [Cyanobacteria bacterium UBA11148]